MMYETIDAKQIDDIMAGRKPRRPAGWDDDNRRGGQQRAVDDEADKPGSDDDASDKRRPEDPFAGSVSDH